MATIPTVIEDRAREDGDLSGRANYAASKSGLFGSAKSLALEAAFSLARAGKLGADSIGLTVNAVTPGLIETGGGRLRRGALGRRWLGLHNRTGVGVHGGFDM